MRSVAVAGLALGLSSSCFSGNGTMGSICLADRDCGPGQHCSDQVCGRCGNGRRQLGEVCLGEAEDAAPGGDRILAVLDADGDGRDDVVANDGTTLVLRLNGGASLEEGQILAPEADAAAAGDVDGDGSDEVLFTVGPSWSLWPSGSTGDLGGFLGSVALGDLDGDGAEDAAVADSDGQVVHVLLAESGALSAATSEVGCAGVVVEGMGDLDQDGATDILVSCRDESRVRVYAGDGAGGIAIGQTITLERPVRSATLLHLDGNLTMDVAILTTAERLELYYGRGGALEGPTTIETMAPPRTVLAGDRTLEGSPDLVVADETGLSIFPSRLGSFPDEARRELDGKIAGAAALDYTGFDTRDLVLGTDQGLLIIPETP